MAWCPVEFAERMCGNDGQRIWSGLHSTAIGPSSDAPAAAAAIAELQLPMLGYELTSKRLHELNVLAGSPLSPKEIKWYTQSLQTLTDAEGRLSCVVYRDGSPGLCQDGRDGVPPLVEPSPAGSRYERVGRLCAQPRNSRGRFPGLPCYLRSRDMVEYDTTPGSPMMLMYPDFPTDAATPYLLHRDRQEWLNKYERRIDYVCQLPSGVPIPQFRAGGPLRVEQDDVKHITISIATDEGVDAHDADRHERITTTDGHAYIIVSELHDLPWQLVPYMRRVNVTWPEWTWGDDLTSVRRFANVVLMEGNVAFYGECARTIDELPELSTRDMCSRLLCVFENFAHSEDMDDGWEDIYRLARAELDAFAREKDSEDKT